MQEPARAPPAAVQRALRRYAERIEADLAEREFTRSLVGMQVVFEGLRAVVLRKLDIGLSEHGQCFAPLRLLLLRQEDAHHEFGVRSLQRLVGSAEECAGLRTALRRVLRVEQRDSAFLQRALRRFRCRDRRRRRAGAHRRARLSGASST
ncbi:MAG: hypothetical protein H7X91_08825 [Burkholderiales bacterium]|nr:hypothetical protein [Burkholderiales bacterium]